ncbi:hypothetical+protein [Methylocapsa aurea]|uniref:phage major capsid protein n=1 Tax=Methylocapsa aurea TaxID=663610 RepID=UPI003D18CB4A
MSLILDLKKTKTRAVEKLGTDEVINSAELYEAVKAEIAEIDAKLARAEDAQSRAAALARPAGAHVESEAQTGVEGYEEEVAPEVERLAQSRALTRGVATRDLAYASNARAAGDRFQRALGLVRATNGIRLDKGKHFRGFGEQLQAIYTAANSRGMTVDPRLVRAPTGAGEVDPTGGGFLLQTDFSQAIFMLAHDMGEIWSRVNRIPISANSNGIKIPAVDETSRATGSRWGGVQTYWADEGTAPTSSKPSFRMLEFSLHKLISLMYTSDELLQDSTALTTIASQAFSEEIVFMTEDAIFEGTGAGQPLGFIKHPALISVAAETGQKAGTIVKENLDKIYSRIWGRSRRNSAWLINQDALPQLFELGQTVGTGGLPVFVPPGGVSAEPYATLYGRPVIETEYSAALGSVGDIALVDLTQYTAIDKGGVQAATSMHVAFLTDQQVFRVTYRVDGQPMWTKPLTRFKGNSVSPFVALAAR